MANEPITREEILLNAVATDEQANIKPITREEMYLAKLGGADVTVPTPVTRKEQFLQKAIENVGNTGGGGGGSAVDPNSIVGTWVFNDVLTSAIDVIDTQEKYDEGAPYHPFKFSFKNYMGETCGAVSFCCSTTIGHFDDGSENGVSFDNYIFVEDESGSWGYDDGWYVEQNKTITITEEPSAEVAAWIRANAIKQPQPFIYDVATIDHLPTDAPEFSMAVVAVEYVEYNGDVKGWWRFNPYVEFTESYLDVNFIAIDEIYGLARYDTICYQDQYLNFIGDGSVVVYDSENEVWLDDRYRNICITSADRSDEFISWITNNAQRILPPKLYIRENGEWVYKSDIV